MRMVKFNSENKNNAQRGLMPAFSNVFDSVFTDGFFSGRDTALVPAVNICDVNDRFQIELAAPGLNKEDFKISLDRRMLTVSVAKEQAENDEQANYTRREFSYVAFTRSFTLPEVADEHSISASYQDGILRVDIPKKEDAKKQVRQIQVG